jgi:hypothetical protein
MDDMKFQAWTIVCLLGVVCGTVRAQSPADGERALRAAVMNHQLYMRGFSADPVMRWRWDGKTLVEERPAVRMFGVFLAGSLIVTGDKVEIRGELHALLEKKDSTLVLAQASDNVMITADLTGADVARLLPQLPGLLFYPDKASALADVPEQYRALLPMRAGATLYKTEVPADKSCDCTTRCGKPFATVGMTGMAQPKVKSDVEPVFTDEAGEKKFDGIVQVGALVNASGHPGDFWIVRAVGMGLDENAAEAVSQYVYAPPMCHGHPTAEWLLVNVNFRIY